MGLTQITKRLLNLFASKGDLLVYPGSASGVPSLLGVGTDGQVLTANSAATNGLDWETPAAATSPLTTKGDIYTFSTVNARLPVGTNGQVLTSNSAAATGLFWTTQDPIVVGIGVPATHTATTVLTQIGGSGGVLASAILNNVGANYRVTAKFQGIATAIANTFTFYLYVQLNPSSTTLVASFTTAAITSGSFAITVQALITTITTGSSGVIDVSTSGVGAVDGSTSTVGTPLAYSTHSTFTLDLTQGYNVIAYANALTTNAGDSMNVIALYTENIST